MKTFKELKALLKGASPEGLSLRPVRMALLGDSATQLLSTAIRGEAIDRGVRLEFFEAEYGQVERQLLDPDSDFHRFGAEWVVIYQSAHKLALRHAALDPPDKVSLARERLDFISSLADDPLLKGKKLVIFNYSEIDDTVFGSYANKTAFSLIGLIRRLNCGLMDIAATHPDFSVLDLSALQAEFGRAWLFPSNLYVSTEMTLSLEALPYVAARLMDIVCAASGRFKKCLILDLDNTLWGGVIGDDGLGGIQLGHGLGIGKAFSEIQLWVKKLRERGIIICVVSKNDEAAAREPFLRHPDMVLRIDDIAVFLANWETKVDNIRNIQSILNIGFDSMVFLDDNPFERNIVRENVPGVTVPELPDDPGDWLECLYSLNLFETASFSSEDADRTRQYQVEAGRRAFSRTFQNEDDYLRSLGMVSLVEGFTPFNIPRVAQLTQRSNQFNLRTARYSEADISALAADPSAIGLSFTLEDRFGDNGLVVVAILKPYGPDGLFIDTWLMSCRVLKRGMEAFTLDTLVSKALERGYNRLVGEYIPTAKNKMVEGHYPSLGFTPLESPDGRRLYELRLPGFAPIPNHIAVKE